MQNIRPCNENNAIKSAAFALELSNEINSDIIESIRSFYESDAQFKIDFPVEEPIKSVKIQVTNDIQQISSANIGGLNYFKKSTDGLKNEWILRIEANSIVLTFNTYSRWDNVWHIAKKYFTHLAHIINNKYELNKVVVEYLDEFIITNLDNNTWVKELYRDESPYIPKFVYDIQEPWHSHNGFISEEANTRTINLINMNFNKANRVQVNSFLSMQTQHASSFYEKIPFSVDNIDHISKVATNNHDSNKQLLKNVLSDEMLKAIKLKD